MDGIENGEITPSAREQVNALLRRSFRPEFLNRLDEIIMFKPLTKDHIGQIVDILLARLSKRLQAENLTLEVTGAAKEYLADFGYDSVFGARPLKRFIQTHVETPIARFMIAENPEAGSKIVLDRNADGLYLRT